MTHEELLEASRAAEIRARKTAMRLAVAAAQNRANDVLPPLVEAADAILKIAEITARTIRREDFELIMGDVVPDAVLHLAELLMSGMPFEEARQRAVAGLDDVEEALHTFIAKRAADAWKQAEEELAVILRGTGIA